MTQQEKAEAVDLLQDLGLKVYEARSFLALTQLPAGTAKEIHEISEVPRTRVYDATRVLESEGLVEVQHSSPQQYRAVSVEEATRILSRKFDDRIDTLETHLESLESRVIESGDDRIQEVWSLTGHDAIESRTLDLIEGAESEIALVVVDDSLLSDAFFDRLHTAVERDVSITLGGKTKTITERLGAELPNVRVFETELEWLTGPWPDHEVAISRMLLVDQETLLVGSYYPEETGSTETEQAVFVNGLNNGIVVLLQRIISTGIPTTKPRP